jgi:DNA replication initiation complex subunit (GINS family)
MPDQFTLLLEWRRNEAAGRGLAKLPPDYYTGTSGYLGELRRSYEADLRENPSSRKGEISRQTYQRASQVARDILEGRVQKILSLAFQASIGGARELPNALPEERRIFDELLRTLLEFRRSAAPFLEPMAAVTAAGTPPATAPTAAPAATKAPEPEALRSPKPVAPRGTSPLAYVRIVAEGHTVEVGADTLDLRIDDIVSLPPATARLLVETKVAEPVTVARPSGT